MLNFDHEEHYNRGYQPIACGPMGGSSHGSTFGAFGIILVFIFLIILFAAFRGNLGGHEGGHAGYGHGGGYGKDSIADFEAIAQNNNRVDRGQVQLANYIGDVKEQITLGNYQLSSQMDRLSAASELRACMEREADMRFKISAQDNKILQLQAEAFNERKFDALGAQLANINCRMNNLQEKQFATPIVGVERLGCTNEPFRGNPFGGFDQRNGNNGCSTCV